MKLKRRTIEDRLALTCQMSDGNAGAGDEHPEWLTSLGEDAMAHIEKNNYSTESQDELLKTLVTSDIGAMAKLGRPQGDLIIKPSGEFAENKDEYMAVMRGLGAPENKDGYGDAPAIEGLEFKDGQWGKLTEKLAENGVPPFMVEGVLQGVGEMVREQMAEAAGKTPDELAQEGTDALIGELGKAKAEETIKAAKGFLKQKGDEGFIAHLEESGLGNDPRMMKFLAGIAADYKESGLIKNPDSDDGGAKTLSKAQAQEQIRQLEADPNFMKQLQNRADPNHKAAVKKRNDLYELAHEGA